MKNCESGLKPSIGSDCSIQNHYETILNYCSNVAVESSNSGKIKAFRKQFRGVRNVEFFTGLLGYFQLNAFVVKISEKILNSVKFRK